MKKIFFFLIIVLLGYWVIGLFSPSKVLAQIDLLNYFFPADCPPNFISNGELFQCKPAGDNCFIIQKSADPRYYEKFCYDDNFIYHYEDTTWADDYGNVKCNGTDDNAYFTLLDGNWGPRGQGCPGWDPDKEGMKWIPRQMEAGDCFTSEGTVVGFNKRTGECCETPYTGPGGGHTMCLTLQGCLVFPTGSVCENGIALQVTGGAGAGETYYYCQDQGWVGFNRGIGTGGAYATNELGGEQTDECLVIEDTLMLSVESLICEPQSTGDRDSRPDACDPCNITSYLAQSCATSFTVNDTVKYERREGAKEPPHCVEPDWKGTVIIDASNTTIPFVGKKREDDIESREDEQKYLADYFEGTDEYYRSYDVQVAGKTIFHGVSSTLLPNYQGVLRKLTPMEYQDELKKEMVQRAQKTVASGGELEPGGIHNYNVAYKPRICWDFPFLTETIITIAQNIAGIMNLPFDDAFDLAHDLAHYCVYNFSLGDEAKINGIQG